MCMGELVSWCVCCVVHVCVVCVVYLHSVVFVVWGLVCVVCVWRMFVYGGVYVWCGVVWACGRVCRNALCV